MAGGRKWEQRGVSLRRRWRILGVRGKLLAMTAPRLADESEGGCLSPRGGAQGAPCSRIDSPHKESGRVQIHRVEIGRSRAWRRASQLERGAIWEIWEGSGMGDIVGVGGERRRGRLLGGW